MKKRLLLLLLVYITITAAGQVSIPNGGFETWNSITYNTPKNYPITSNPEVLDRGGIIPNVVKVDIPVDVNHGNFAVKVSTLADGSTGYFLNSDPVNDPNPATWTGGIPYNQIPATIQGYYKYHSGDSNDKGTIIVAFRDASGGDIGSFSFNVGGEQANYTLFSFPIPTLTGIPAKVIICVTSSDLINGGDKGVAGSVLFIDNISFTGVGISQPALMNGDFEEVWDTNQTPLKLADWYSNNNNGSEQAVKQTTDRSDGSYALELTSYMGRNQQDQDQVQSGQVSTQYYDQQGPHGGIPFSYKIGKLVFKYKYTPVGNDNAQINLNFKQGNSDSWSGINLSSSTSYQTKEIPFTLNFIPDYVNIFINSSGNNPVVGSALIIDDLQFTSLGNSATLTWTGSQDDNWKQPNNWTPNNVPTNADDVIIPQASSRYPTVYQDPDGSTIYCNNLTIESGASFTIAPRGIFAVNGTLTNNNNAGTIGLNIKSDITGTGSLIIYRAVSGTGSALVQRYMTTDAWHIVTSPLSGQSINNFLTNGSNTNVIRTNGTARGMMDYDPTTNSWNTYFTDAKAGILETGKGFAMHGTGSSPAIVNFTGSLRVGNQSVPVSGGTGGFWNCIGNPYTSAIGITDASSSTTGFLTSNLSNFEPSYAAIYVWDQLDANNHGQAGQYKIINNTYNLDYPFDDVQQGQAFMVNMKAGVTAVSFTTPMQTHTPDLGLKSSKVAWPTIKLLAAVGVQKSSTIIAFNSSMTKGLDPTYDAGLLKGGSDLLVYSKLVEDNGIPFAIQALPDNDFSNMIIPIGLDFKTGGVVVFSSELMNLPSDCKVILEDMLTKTFTDLSKDTYKTTIAANSIITDRFRLKTASTTTGLDKEPVAVKLTAYSNRNIEIRVSGAVSKNAVATLYDVHGRIVLVKILEEGNLNIIPTPNIKTGIYMLSVNDKGKSNGFKILVSE